MKALRRWVAVVFILVIAVPVIFCATMYAGAWYYRWRASELIGIENGPAWSDDSNEIYETHPSF